MMMMSKWFVVLPALFLAGNFQLPTEQKTPDPTLSITYKISLVCGRLDGKVACVCGGDTATLFSGKLGAFDVLVKPTVNCGTEIPKAFEKFDTERKTPSAEPSPQEPLDKK